MTSVAAVAFNPSQALLITTAASTVSSALYELACAIFRVIAMTFQYIVVGSSIIFNHLPFFSSALPAKNLKVSSRNIASLHVFPKCLATAWHPESKSMYEEIGQPQGLRITHDVILRPASGLCLGKSLIFLSESLKAEEGMGIADLVAAAKRVQGSKNESSVQLQAIYDALMGLQGKVQLKDKNLFKQLLQGKEIVSQTDSNEALFRSIEAFLSYDEQADTLRQFVLDDLERQEIKITPDLYSLILELDTLWDLQQHPNERKNDSAHSAIIQAVAHCVQLEPMETLQMDGKIAAVAEQLEELEIGSYLIRFPHHSIAYVKTQEHLSLFEPNEGLALFDQTDQQAALLQLLHYYADNDGISLKVTSFHCLEETQN